MENNTESVKERQTPKNKQLKQRILNEEMLKSLPGGYHCCSSENGYPFIYIGDGFLGNLGWTKDEIETEFDNKFLNLVHPDDREQVIDYVVEISAESGNENKGHRSVYRLLGKDGYHWIADDEALINIYGEFFFRVL